jgi:cell wall-associated NlpC family hydrolase
LTRERIVQEALSWRGTPYRDHAGMKGVGVDCAFLLLRVYQNVGLVPSSFTPPKYYPQQWFNSPCQKDRLKLKFEDRTFLEIVQQLTKREISETEVGPGDLVLWRLAASWTHGGIIIRWPEYVVHAVTSLRRLGGVCGSHGTEEGFIKGRPRRFFSAF